MCDAPDFPAAPHRGEGLETKLFEATAIDAFLAWVDRVDELTDLRNSPALMRWSMDKHYLLDLEAVVLDGSFGAALKTALIDAVTTALARYSWEGVSRPTIVAGTIGSDARALGGALLPLYEGFAPDRALFLKV